MVSWFCKNCFIKVSLCVFNVVVKGDDVVDMFLQVKHVYTIIDKRDISNGLVLEMELETVPKRILCYLARHYKQLELLLTWFEVYSSKTQAITMEPSRPAMETVTTPAKSIFAPNAFSDSTAQPTSVFTVPPPDYSRPAAAVGNESHGKHNYLLSFGSGFNNPIYQPQLPGNQDMFPPNQQGEVLPLELDV